jgi:hypothetical protein
MSDEDREVGGSADTTEADAEQSAAAEEPIAAESTETPDVVEAAGERAAAEAPEESAAAEEFEAPAPRKTGLIVVVGAALVVFAALVVGAFILAGGIANRSATGLAAKTPARANITQAMGFTEALMNGETMAIKPFLLDSVQGALTAAQWAEVASQDATAGYAFSQPSWSGDRKAVVPVSTSDSTGTLTFMSESSESTAVVVTVDIAGTSQVYTVELIRSAPSWRIVSMTDGVTPLVFDETLVKSLVDTTTATP